MRLDKRVAQALSVSRKMARQLIRAGEIAVDTKVQRDPGLAVENDSLVSHFGQTLDVPGPIYLMLYKPENFVCGPGEDQYPSAQSLVGPWKDRTLHYAGRLDADATGLVLLTDDGQWSHRITSPKSQCSKVYQISLAEPASPEALKDIESGLMLRGESRPTKPAKIHRSAEQPCEVTIEVTEGRYHLVKRLFAAIGNRVVTLHRVQIGSLRLDSELEPGQYRELTSDEVSEMVGGRNAASPDNGEPSPSDDQ